MPNPFKKEINGSLIDAYGIFGCFTPECGKVIGEARYNEDTEVLIYTCPDGHKNEMVIKI